MWSAGCGVAGFHSSEWLWCTGGVAPQQDAGLGAGTARSFFSDAPDRSRHRHNGTEPAGRPPPLRAAAGAMAGRQGVRQGGHGPEYGSRPAARAASKPVISGTWTFREATGSCAHRKTGTVKRAVPETGSALRKPSGWAFKLSLATSTRWALSVHPVKCALHGHRPD